MVRKGRSPCCDKTKVKRGPWSPAEDARLVSFIMEHGHTNWRALPQQAGLLRCGKSCRLRWINYLRPDVKRGNFSPEEEEIIINLHNSMGNKWSMIAAKLPGRTDNEIKNVWNTHLKKKVCRNGATTTTTTSDLNRSKDSSTGYSSSASASSGSCISYGDINRQSDGYRVSAAVMESDQNQEPNKGESESLSPCNSYISTTNVQSLIGGVVEEEPEPTSTTTTNETKEEAKISEEKIINEIPSDNDVEFWNWFESLTDPILPRDEQQPCEEFEGQERESQKMMVEEGGEEYKKWLKYLENELGLADFGGEESENDDLMFRSEMWPSPPPSHGFGI